MDCYICLMQRLRVPSNFQQRQYSNMEVTSNNRTWPRLQRSPRLEIGRRVTYFAWGVFSDSSGVCLAVFPALPLDQRTKRSSRSLDHTSTQTETLIFQARVFVSQMMPAASVAASTRFSAQVLGGYWTFIRRCWDLGVLQAATMLASILEQKFSDPEKATAAPLSRRFPDPRLRHSLR